MAVPPFAKQFILPLFYWFEKEKNDIGAFLHPMSFL